jgi:hypothetical protein
VLADGLSARFGAKLLRPYSNLRGRGSIPSFFPIGPVRRRQTNFTRGWQAELKIRPRGRKLFKAKSCSSYTRGGFLFDPLPAL